MKEIINKLIKKETFISIIGLGYVGLPLAYNFSKQFKTIGFDIDENKINRYMSGTDLTGEVGNDNIKNATITFTSNFLKLKEALFHIVAVPTPVNIDNTPDLKPLQKASEILGKVLKKGSIVVYESTVYPGVTEEFCVPILEKKSGLKCGIDFKVGYSPERINPGDKLHKLENVTKIVSGMDLESLQIIYEIYKYVVKDAPLYKAPSIKVAEAAKVIENAQRDINIAFMNEISIIFHKLNIDTNEVLKAASTKWNFLPFKPGLVGGHCISIDPYYLTYISSRLGYESQVILSGRKVNESVGKFISENIIDIFKKNNKDIKKSKVGILGFTFKENCNDIRNTKVFDIIKLLNEFGIDPITFDPLANHENVKIEYGINLVPFSKFKNLDLLIVAVAHDEFKNISVSKLMNLYGDNKFILFDLKGIYNKKQLQDLGFTYWSL